MQGGEAAHVARGNLPLQLDANKGKEEKSASKVLEKGQGKGKILLKQNGKGQWKTIESNSL